MLHVGDSDDINVNRFINILLICSALIVNLSAGTLSEFGLVVNVARDTNVGIIKVI